MARNIWEPESSAYIHGKILPKSSCQIGECLLQQQFCFLAQNNIREITFTCKARTFRTPQSLTPFRLEKYGVMPRSSSVYNNCLSRNIHYIKGKEKWFLRGNGSAKEN